MATKYVQLADLLRAKAKLLLKEGATKLPTENELVSTYGVSRQTVRNALALLEEEGTIERRQGSGSYIKPQARDENVHQIAVITTFIDDYIFPTILHDAQNIFLQNGYSTLVYATENKVGRENEILSSLMSNSISALLIEGSKTALPTPNASFFEYFKKNNIPVLFLHGTYSNAPLFPSVTDDNYGGGYMLGQYLSDKGHTSIAAIFKSDDMQGPARYHGLVSAMLDNKLKLDDKRICWYGTEDRKAFVNGDYERIDSFIKTRLVDVSAIVCYNDEIAHILINRLIEDGKRVPEDIAVVSFDNSFYSQIGSVSVTSLSHTGTKTGAVAAKLLVNMLKGNEVESIVLKWNLICRESG